MWQYPRKKLVQYTEIGMTRKLISRRKSVRYTEIRHTISHMKSRMRESRTSGSVRGVPCERYVYSTPVLNCKRKMNKK